MKTNYLENLKILRQKIPVGAAYALKVLETTDGNIEQAETVLKEEYITELMEKTGASKELVHQCLIKNNFNIEASLKEIESKIYSSTELIFKYYSKDKRRGITLVLDVIEKKIAATIEEDQKFTIYGYGCWFNFELFKTLDPPMFCFATIAGWLFYEYCEGFDHAIYYHTEEVTEQIEKKLYLPEIANYIRICKERYSFLSEKYERKKNGFIKAYSEVRKDSLYKQAEKGYFDNEELLIETLYNYSKTHIELFP